MRYRPFDGRKYIGTRRMESEGRSEDQANTGRLGVKQGRARKQFVLCLSNRGFRDALIPRRLYLQLPDEKASRHGLVRVVDESGEDYLFPTQLFAPIELPPEVRSRLRS